MRGLWTVADIAAETISAEYEIVEVPLPDHHEDGVEVPMESINPDTLRNLIAEFVTREWEEVGDSHFTLNDKINQVLRQLQEKKAKVVFDLTTNTCNIVPGEGKGNS